MLACRWQYSNRNRLGGGVGKFSLSRADKTVKVRTFPLHLFRFSSAFSLFEARTVVQNEGSYQAVIAQSCWKDGRHFGAFAALKEAQLSPHVLI